MNREIVRRAVYTVSQLNTEIKHLLESKFPFVWVAGEISNFSVPASGHYYFTLKDSRSQISAVMFRGQNRHLRFMPKEGMRVSGMGRVGVYEPRGAYQVIFEHMEPQGAGQLQAAFEQLKARLAHEGLFHESRKKPLPFLPSKIALITSPTGAVVHDILDIARRRFPNIQIVIIPARVQGEGADLEIASAIRFVNTRPDVDIVILARGGGSLEDLMAFNSETVARAIFASEIPVISAVGHETDYTIADFTADLRAPTPSAAAELAIPMKSDLRRDCVRVSHALAGAFDGYIERRKSRLAEISRRLVHPGKRVQDLRLAADDLFMRLARQMENLVDQKRERFSWRLERLRANNPAARIPGMREKLETTCRNLDSAMRSHLESGTTRLAEATSKLHALSPKAVLARGYSITRSIPENKPILDAGETDVNREVEVTLAKGAIRCRVEGIIEDGQTEETNI